VTKPNQTQKVALITGAAKRLGRSIALHLGQEGYFCWIHYNTSHSEAQETLKLLKKLGGQGKIIQADQSSYPQVQRACRLILKNTPGIDCLVNNVGIYTKGPLEEFSPLQFESIIQTNLLGPYFWIRELHAHLNKNACIINLGYTGLQRSWADTQATAYTISKLGMHQLTLAWASSLASRNIRVNTISPGQLENSIDLPKNLKKAIPMKRAGTLNEIIGLVDFLLSKQASYITGQNIEVAGGYMMKLI